MNKLLIAVVTGLTGFIVGAIVTYHDDTHDGFNQVLKRHSEVVGKEPQQLNKPTLFVAIDAGCFEGGVLTLPKVNTHY